MDKLFAAEVIAGLAKVAMVFDEGGDDNLPLLIVPDVSNNPSEGSTVEVGDEDNGWDFLFFDSSGGSPTEDSFPSARI